MALKREIRYAVLMIMKQRGLARAGWLQGSTGLFACLLARAVESTGLQNALPESRVMRITECTT